MTGAALAPARAVARLPRPSSVSMLFGLLLLYIIIAVVGPLLWGRDPNDTDLLSRLRPPSPSHPFGTDEFGRDLLARFLAGARLSIALGVGAVAAAAFIGTLWGSVAGLVGGGLDGALMRIMDAVLAFPALTLGMAIALALGPGVIAAGVAVAVSGVPWYARRVRSEVLSLRSRPYIEAERVMGASDWHILFRHLIPGVFGGVAVQASLGVGYGVLTIAGLGFIGLGVQPPTAEWGSMITAGRQYLLSGEWWISLIPGVGILALVAITTALGDAINDRLSSGR